MKIEIDVPDDLYEEAQLIARAQHMSVGDIFASALSDHLAIWRRLKKRAAVGSREAFLKVLDAVPDVEPEKYDQLDIARKPAD